MICYHCRKKIADDAKYCPECGAPTKRVGEAPTQTIVLPPDFEELEPAPAPVKPERKLEFPKVELPKVDFPKVKPEKPEEEPAAPPKTEEPLPEAPARARPALFMAVGATTALLIVALLFGIWGGSPPDPLSPGVIPEQPVPMEPVEFTDAALWHTEQGIEFPFTHAYDGATYENYVLQDYSQQYMEPAEAAALFESYFTYLTTECGFERTGDKAVEMSILPWQYVWFEHPDARVTNFAAAEMNSAIGGGSCDLAYAFQYGTDGNLLVTCYYSPMLTMQKGELPPVEQLPPRVEFDDLAIWYGENNKNGRYWRVDGPQKTTDSYKQEYGTKDSSVRAVIRVLERYFERSLTAGQNFTLAGSKTYEDETLDMGYYWFDYTGDRELKGFAYNNRTSAHTVYNCDLVYGYYIYADGTVELYSYFDKELVPRDSERVVKVDSDAADDNDSAGAGQPDGPLAPEHIPEGAVPEIGAYSGGAFTLMSDTATRESTEMTYSGTADTAFFTQYIDLLARYGFRVADKRENNRALFTQVEYLLVYEGEGEVGTFAHDADEISLHVKYWSIGRSGDLVMTYARGVQPVDTGDRGTVN